MNNFFKQKYLRNPLIISITSLLIILIGSLFIGEFNNYEAKQLIDTSVSGLNTLSNTIVLASATILALLLTSLGITSTTNSRLTKDHYKLVLLIAKIDTGVFVVALVFFLLFNLPVTQSETIDTSYFIIFYYGSIIVASTISAALIFVVSLLYYSIVSMIEILGLGVTDHPFLKSSKEEFDNKISG